MTILVLKDRADLIKLPAWSEIDLDPSGEPIVWENHYLHEETGESWRDRWSCQCDDQCACCGNDYSPVSSDWIGPSDLLMRALWESLPDSEGEPRAIGVVLHEDGHVELDAYWSITGTPEAPLVTAIGAWPGFDAYARKMDPKLHPDAVVYAADSGADGKPTFSISAAVIVGGEIWDDVPTKTLKPKREAYRAFYDAFEAPETLAYQRPTYSGMEP